MSNPWETISLTDYENHMKQDSVGQLQKLNAMMREQLNCYPVDSVMILGIAGGNGLEHIQKGKYQKVYGIDVNPDYIQATVKRYPELAGILECQCVDLCQGNVELPRSQLLIANLLIEYVGYENFQNAIRQVQAKYVSCIIQINLTNQWVSESPYLHAFVGLEEVHHQIEETTITMKMSELGYHCIKTTREPILGGKELVQMDYTRCEMTPI